MLFADPADMLVHQSPRQYIVIQVYSSVVFLVVASCCLNFLWVSVLYALNINICVLYTVPYNMRIGIIEMIYILITIPCRLLNCMSSTLFA